MNIEQFIDEIVAFIEQKTPIKQWIDFAIDYYQKYSMVVLIIVGLLILFLGAVSFNNFVQAINHIVKFIKLILRLIKWILLKIYNALVYLFKNIAFFFKCFSLKKLVYNVIPVKYKSFSYWIHWLLSFGIRRDVRQRYRCIDYCQSSRRWIHENMKTNSMLDASVGKGKTSFLAGLSHMKTLDFLDMIDSDMKFVEKVVHKVNYFKLKKDIESLYTAGLNENEILKEIIKDESIKYAFVGVFNNYVEELPYDAILKKYISAYCAKLRNVYVMCNFKLFNRITKTFNYALEVNSFNIKDPTTQKNYYLPAYCIYIDDEKSLDPNYKNTINVKDVDKTGIDTIMRLFRQLKNETTCYISSSQNTDRIVKIVRELANTYFSIQKLEIVGSQPRLRKVYEKQQEKFKKKMEKKSKFKYINAGLFHHKRVKRTEEEAEEYMLSDNEFKCKIYDSFIEERKVFAASYVRYTVTTAKSLKETEKDVAELNTYQVYFPLTWVFGIYLKCEYAEFDEFLTNLSGKSDHDLKVIKSMFDADQEKFKKMISPEAPSEDKKKGRKKNE